MVDLFRKLLQKEARPMSYDDLLCAACSGRVVKGGCPTCRVSRERLPGPAPLPAQALLIAAVLVLLAIALLTR